jgi:hypothetical protein
MSIPLFFLPLRCAFRVNKFLKIIQSVLSDTVIKPCHIFTSFTLPLQNFSGLRTYFLVGAGLAVKFLVFLDSPSDTLDSKLSLALVLLALAFGGSTFLVSIYKSSWTSSILLALELIFACLVLELCLASIRNPEYFLCLFLVFLLIDLGFKEFSFCLPLRFLPFPSGSSPLLGSEIYFAGFLECWFSRILSFFGIFLVWFFPAPTDRALPSDAPRVDLVCTRRLRLPSLNFLLCPRPGFLSSFVIFCFWNFTQTFLR